MALIAMAVYDTQENDRTWMTAATLESLTETVDFHQHSLVISDNGSWIETTEVYERYLKIINETYGEGTMKIIFNGENIGTARAINKAWAMRNPGEHCVKMDNDVVIHQEHWLDMLEEVVYRDPQYGILGLKRKDCIETPWHNDPWYRSTLVMVPHDLGDRWIIAEHVHHVMGTCQMYSSDCLDKIGYLYQMGGLYGFDDALASIRAQCAGFKTAHFPQIEIDHIDEGKNPYTQWKIQYAGKRMGQYANYKRAYETGSLNVYHGVDDE